MSGSLNTPKNIPSYSMKNINDVVIKAVNIAGPAHVGVSGISFKEDRNI